MQDILYRAFMAMFLDVQLLGFMYLDLIAFLEHLLILYIEAGILLRVYSILTIIG